jgi:phosphate-selective porin OprO/OprP
MHDLAELSAPELSLQRSFSDGQAVRIGQFKHSFLLDDAISDNQAPFMEPSLTAAYAINRRLGIGYLKASQDMSFGVSAFGQRLDGLLDGRGVASRYTRVVSRWNEGFLHLGGSLAYDEPDRGAARFNVRPGARFAPNLADTGNLADVDSTLRYAVEGLVLSGPFSLQAEWVHATADRRTSSSFDSDAYYVMAGWSPTGHQRSYKSGVVSNPKVGEGEQAVELYVRYSRIDLDDGPVRGGELDGTSFGVNWYPHQNVRFMANFIAVDSSRRGVERDPDLLQFRVQVTY